MNRPWVKYFLIALIVRLVFVALFPGVNYYDGITREYLDAAHNLLTGHGLTQYVDIASYSSGQSHFVYEPFIGRPAGYVLFFSFIGLFAGIAPVVFQIVQALITACSTVLVWKLALELFAGHPQVRKIANAAGILAAVWPNQARFEIALLPDGITTLIVLGVILSLVRFLKTAQVRYGVYTGLILALSIYLRPDLVLFPVILIPALFLLFRKQVPVARSLKVGAVIVLLLAVSIGINIWKNYTLSGKVVPLNLGSGTTMFEGISQFGDTLGTTYVDDRVAHDYLDSKQLFYPDGPEHDKKLFAIAVDTIKHHPAFFGKLLLKRIPLMFTVRGLYFSDSVSYLNKNDDLSQRFPGKYIAMFKSRPLEFIARFLSPLLGWVLVLSGFAGVMLAMRYKPAEHQGWWFTTHLLIAIFLLYFIGSHLITNVEPRYFYPCVPLLYAYSIYCFLRLRAKTR